MIICAYRYCDREILFYRKLSRNKVFERHCSLYCHEAERDNIKPIPNNIKGSVPSVRHPPLLRQCYLCRTEYLLEFEGFKNNQRFCGRKCYDKITKYKGGHRDFLLLCILQERGEMFASELARISSAFHKNTTTVGVAQIMRLWASRNIISINKGYDIDQSPKYYIYNSNLLPGEAIKRYSQKR